MAANSKRQVHGDGEAAPREEPLTITAAAARAGVHPNTIRRMVRSGRLSGLLMKGRHGDTWLIDAAELERVMGGGPEHTGATPAQPQPDAPPSPPPGPTRGDAPEPVAGAATTPAALVDLSLDRARALERYTHSLMAPLVDLLREREAAIESREALIRRQAERIGRLEREVELLRERAAGAHDTGRAETAPVPATDEAPAPNRASPDAPDAPDAVAAEAGDETEDDLPEQVTTLASQMARLRRELQMISAALEHDGAAKRDEDPPTADRATDQIPVEPPIAPAAPRAPATPAWVDQADNTDVSSERQGTPSPAHSVLDLSRKHGETAAVPAREAAVTPEEMAGLFPTGGRLGLALQPLPAEEPNVAAAEERGAGRPSTADDPLAQAEAAVRALQHALGPRGTVTAGADDGHASDSDADDSDAANGGAADGDNEHPADPVAPIGPGDAVDSSPAAGRGDQPATTPSLADAAAKTRKHWWWPLW